MASAIYTANSSSQLTTVATTAGTAGAFSITQLGANHANTGTE